MKTAWQIHLANTRAECKGKVSPQEVMKIAAKTYKSKTDPSKNKASCTAKVHVNKHTHKCSVAQGGNKTRIKKGHKGAPSITRPGHLDFVTHKGNKYYNRHGHRYRYNIDGVIGKPYQHTKKHKKEHKNHSRKASRATRRGLGRGVASDACTARLAEVMTALGAANARLAQAQNENKRLSAASVQNMNLQGEIQNYRDQVGSLEKQVSDLQSQAAAVPVIDPIKLPTVVQDKAVTFDATAAIDKAVADVDADEAKGALEQATDAMKNVAGQIADAITGATDSAEADMDAVKSEVVSKINSETTGGKKSVRRRKRGRTTRR